MGRGRAPRPPVRLRRRHRPGRTPRPDAGRSRGRVPRRDGGREHRWQQLPVQQHRHTVCGGLPVVPALPGLHLCTPGVRPVRPLCAVLRRGGPLQRRRDRRQGDHVGEPGEPRSGDRGRTPGHPRRDDRGGVRATTTGRCSSTPTRHPSPTATSSATSRPATAASTTAGADSGTRMPTGRTRRRSPTSPAP